jgi:hypothetical protein
MRFLARQGITSEMRQYQPNPPLSAWGMAVGYLILGAVNIWLWIGQPWWFVGWVIAAFVWYMGWVTFMNLWAGRAYKEETKAIHAELAEKIRRMWGN